MLLITWLNRSPLVLTILPSLYLVIFLSSWAEIENMKSSDSDSNCWGKLSWKMFNSPPFCSSLVCGSEGQSPYPQSHTYQIELIAEQISNKMWIRILQWQILVLPVLTDDIRSYVSMIFFFTVASSWTGAVRSCARSCVWGGESNDDGGSLF